MQRLPPKQPDTQNYKLAVWECLGEQADRGVVRARPADNVQPREEKAGRFGAAEREAVRLRGTRASGQLTGYRASNAEAVWLCADLLGLPPSASIGRGGSGSAVLLVAAR